jgi:hypothetical protein
MLLSNLHMLGVIGGSADYCVGLVIGASLAMLVVAAATAGAGLAVAGAYTPVLAAACGWF